MVNKVSIEAALDKERAQTGGPDGQLKRSEDA
jgi:hypothetical protein